MQVQRSDQPKSLLEWRKKSPDDHERNESFVFFLFFQLWDHVLYTSSVSYKQFESSSMCHFLTLAYYSPG